MNIYVVMSDGALIAVFSKNELAKEFVENCGYHAFIYEEILDDRV